MPGAQREDQSWLTKLPGVVSANSKSQIKKSQLSYTLPTMTNRQKGGTDGRTALLRGQLKKPVLYDSVSNTGTKPIDPH